MSVITIEQLYEQHIKPMSVVEQLQLVSIITQQLVRKPTLVETIKEPQHSIMELQGPSAEIWAGVDAQEYADELRGERKGSPQSVLQLAGASPPKEAEAILQAAQECRHIDWELWE